MTRKIGNYQVKMHMGSFDSKPRGGGIYLIAVGTYPDRRPEPSCQEAGANLLIHYY